MPPLLTPSLPHPPTTPNPSPPEQQPKLSSSHIDLWEHAALLYHHFEWQSAIETFQHLASAIRDREARTLCSLNAALIQARLGDYALAARTLEDAAAAAARTDGVFVLTPFLLGIVEWELGNFIKAEACLEISLLALRRHAGEEEEGDVDFSPYGLGFRLRGEVVEKGLKRLREMDFFGEEGAQRMVGGLVGLEAGGIFEAPVREGSREEEEEGFPGKRREEPVVSVEEGGTASRTRHPDSLAESSSSSPKPTTRNPRETFRELKAFLRGHKPIPTPHHPIPRTLAAAPPHPPTRPPQPLPSTTTTPVEATYHSTWRRRPPTPYTPRDARGEYHSVGELARFIRRYRNQSAPMSPRDPRGRGESTRELATFIRSAGGGWEGGSRVVGGLGVGFFEGGGLGGAEVESLLELYLERGDVGVVRGGGGGGGGGDGGGGVGGKDGEEGITRRFSDPIIAHTTTLVTGAMEKQLPTDPNTPTSSPFPSSSKDSKDEDRPSAKTPTLRLLPNIYDNPTSAHTPVDDDNSSNLTPLSLQLLDSSTPHHHRPVGEDDNPLARFHTAGSETSSLFRHSMVTVERAEVARGEALRRLEGRARGNVKAVRNGTRQDVRENGKTDDGGRGESSSGGGRSTPTKVAYDADGAVDHTADTMVVAKLLPNKMSDGKVMLPTMTTKTTTMGKAKFLPPSHSKPLPPGPPRGNTGRFEVFLSDGFPDRGKDRGRDGVGGRGGVGDEDGERNAVRVPSSKIFEYMSRG